MHRHFVTMESTYELHRHYVVVWVPMYCRKVLQQSFVRFAEKSFIIPDSGERLKRIKATSFSGTHFVFKSRSLRCCCCWWWHQKTNCDKINKNVFFKKCLPVALSGRTPRGAWPWTACRGRPASMAIVTGAARPAALRARSCRRRNDTTSYIPETKCR